MIEAVRLRDSAVARRKQVGEVRPGFVAVDVDDEPWAAGLEAPNWSGSGRAVDNADNQNDDHSSAVIK